MSKSNAFENSLLLHIFQNANIANVGDATGLRSSTVAGSLYVALHTADPGEAGTQSTNEVSYTGYARVAVARSAGGWTVTNNLVQNAVAVTFGQMTAGTGGTVTHWSVGGVTGTGAEAILYKGPIGTAVVGPFTAVVTGNLFTAPGHSLATDNRISFYPAFGKALPTGVTEGTVYFVLAAGLTTDAFTISTTSGGAAVTITGPGGGLAIKDATLLISSGITPEFAINAININED